MKKKLAIIWVFMVVILLGTFDIVFSAGVDPWLRISDIPYTQSHPGLTYNPSSNQFLVVWQDLRGIGWGDVYAQLVDSNGAIAGANFSIAVADDADDWLFNPKPAYNSATNQYLVVWEELRNVADDIYGQRVNANGSMLGAEIVISTAANDQRNPDIVYNSSSNQFLVVFDDDRLTQYDHDIYGVLVNADGALAGVDFPVSIASQNQYFPVVAYDAADNLYLVVWWDLRNPATSGDIYGRFVYADGAMAGAEFAVSISNADQTYPDIAYASTLNQFLVVWTHDADIYGRLVNADQTFAGPEFLIATSSGYLSDPAVSFDPSSNQFLVAWSDSYGWDDIYARSVDANGNVSESVFELAVGMGDYWYPDMAFDSTANQFLVAWRHQACYAYDTYCETYYEIDIYGALCEVTTHYEIYLPVVLK